MDDNYTINTTPDPDTPNAYPHDAVTQNYVSTE